MPEGHTLYRLAGALDHAFAGTAPTVTSPQGRFAEGAAELDGRVLRRAESRGKHLFLHFGDDLILDVHLGLIGSFDVLPYAGGRGAEPAPVGAVRVRLVNDDYYADLRGATVVQLIDDDQTQAILARLGPDPLRIDPAEPTRGRDLSYAAVLRSKRSLAELLMDQSVVAGVGNVYRCEVLFRHRVNPFTPGVKVKRQTWQAIWDDLVHLLPIGVAFGQIITVEEQLEQAEAILGERDPLQPDPSWAGVMAGERGRVNRREVPGPIPREYAVYKRDGQPCPVCGSRIRTAVVAGRNLFWCGRCQRRH